MASTPPLSHNQERSPAEVALPASCFIPSSSSVFSVLPSLCGSGTKQDRNRPQWIIGFAERIIGSSTPSILDLYSSESGKGQVRSLQTLHILNTTISNCFLLVGATEHWIFCRQKLGKRFKVRHISRVSRDVVVTHRSLQVLEPCFCDYLFAGAPTKGMWNRDLWLA